MRDFRYESVTDASAAVQSSAADHFGKFIAGGTTLVDLMKLDVEIPTRLIDINPLPLAEIRESEGGGLRIGAMARNSTVAHHPLVLERYPILSEALLAGASAQLRNMATMGGNLLQRTRCSYFRDTHWACNKRVPGSGCAAQEGHHRGHALFGISEKCFATYPSDMAVALACLEPTIETLLPNGEQRMIPFAEFHTLPGDTPHIETVLKQGELITALNLPPLSREWRSKYLKVRDRESYEFALVSVAALLREEGGVIREARIAFGGVATKPWRASNVEQALTGGRTIEEAAALSTDGAVPHRDNAFKLELLPRVVRRACELAMEGEAQ